jgi:hypothetical protein
MVQYLHFRILEFPLILPSDLNLKLDMMGYDGTWMGTLQVMTCNQLHGKSLGESIIYPLVNVYIAMENHYF